MRRLQQPRSLVLLSVLAIVTVACEPKSATPTTTSANLVTQALADTSSLTSYHFVRTLEADEQSMAGALLAGMKTEGDFVAPASLYLQNENFSMLSDAPGEELHSGGIRYIRGPGDTWVLEWPEQPPEAGPGPNTSTDADFVTRQFDLLLSNASSYADEGMVSLEITATGATTPTVVSTRHITYTIDAAKWASSKPSYWRGPVFGSRVYLGPVLGGSVYIDPANYHLHRFTLDVDLGQAIEEGQATSEAPTEGTPRPGGATPTSDPLQIVTTIYTISRHNDPSITVPSP